MKRCLYCGKNKDDLSDEHILPKSLGGNIPEKNPLIINNVCCNCNNLCGMFVDEPFLKNFYTQNFKSDAHIYYSNLDLKPILPLKYMGISHDYHFENNICEVWLGPTGDSIFHFHPDYPNEKDIYPIFGIPSSCNNKLNLDYGFVIVFLSTNNPEWYDIILSSIYKHFTKSKIYIANIGNMKFQNKTMNKFFPVMPDKLIPLKNMLFDRHKNQEKQNLIIETNNYAADRFLSKLALGFGYLYLGESFLESPSAEKLRSFLWTKERSERNDYKITFESFLQQNTISPIQNYLHIPGSHVFFIFNARSHLILHASFYEFYNNIIVITDDEILLNKKMCMGIIYIVILGYNYCSQPIKVSDFILYHSNQKHISDLEDIYKIIEKKMNYLHLNYNNDA